MKMLVDGYVRLDAKDVEILQFVHEQYFGAYLHFKMLCQDQSESISCSRRIRELVKRRYLEEKQWKNQRIRYFVLGLKGFKALKKGIYRAHLMPLYRVPDSLNRRLGDRLKAGMVRVIFRQLGLNDCTSERALTERDQRKYPVPTGELKIGGQKIAVLLERARKRTLKAYEQLFQDYIRYGYDQVWMIVDWEIENFLSQMRKEFRSSRTKVWFASYDEFVKNGAETHFYNQEGESFLLRDFVSEVKGAIQP